MGLCGLREDRPRDGAPDAAHVLLYGLHGNGLHIQADRGGKSELSGCQPAYM